MLFCMRTTLDSTTIAIIEDALRDNLSATDDGERLPPVELPVSRMSGGVRPGVDLDDTAALLDLLEAGARPEKRGR
jgi:hypothetical protein